MNQIKDFKYIDSYLENGVVSCYFSVPNIYKDEAIEDACILVEFPENHCDTSHANLFIAPVIDGNRGDFEECPFKYTTETIEQLLDSCRANSYYVN